MDRYKETVEYLYGQLPMFQVLGPGAYKPGLDTAHRLDNAFGNPHRKFKTIHIAGTNGKGSTSHSIASVLAAAGYKVGLYTSPHLVDFRERIRVNGHKISEEAVVDFVDRYRDMQLGLEPSFFELTTIMAFDYFASQEVDYAVIEVGLGGRLDTTNIIMPVLSVITNVSLDHVSLLGDTVEQIAAEKSGIMKPGVPVVIGEADDSLHRVYAELAATAGAPILFAQDCQVPFAETEDGHYVYGVAPGAQIDIESDLAGDCQPRNANTVLAALRVLFATSCLGALPSGLTPLEAIAQGMRTVKKSTGLMGRWMVIGQSPEVVCDTGHNLGAWQYLAPRLARIAQERTVRVVLGFANDKDAESIFRLLPRQAHYYYVEPSVKRARSAAELQAIGRANGLDGDVFATVSAGYAQALKDSAPDDLVYVGGSNFVVAEVLQ